jgi:ElaB/YqjD/DUF883 family membrane-anchored ribosome-binding protein
MTFYEISQNLDNQYKTWSRDKKAWVVIGVVTLAVLLLVSIGGLIYVTYQKNKAISEYEQLLHLSKQNYYLQTIENQNLSKKLQDMSLRLAELKNNTIELERMFRELSEEKVSLEEIRSQMELGLKNTRYQLDKMQSSVTYLIDQRKKTVIKTEDEIIYEKTDTHGK